MKHYKETETRIFCRITAREPIMELARIPHAATDSALTEIIGNLTESEKSSFEIMGRAIAPEKMVARHGQRRLRCDAGRVRQDFAAIQAHGREPAVMFV